MNNTLEKIYALRMIRRGRKRSLLEDESMKRIAADLSLLIGKVLEIGAGTGTEIEEHGSRALPTGIRVY